MLYINHYPLMINHNACDTSLAAIYINAPVRLRSYGKPVKLLLCSKFDAGRA